MDITSFSAIVAAISVVVGVIFAIIQMRHATKTRTTGLVIQLNPALRADLGDLIESSNIIWKQEFTTYEEYIEKYGNPWTDKPLLTLLAYNDGLGYLLRKRLIDKEIIEYLSEGNITVIWEKLQPIITGMRENYHLPDMFESFDYLYNELKNTHSGD
jgi:hypothetical protein